jgi:hypothetical protein
MLGHISNVKHLAQHVIDVVRNHECTGKSGDHRPCITILTLSPVNFFACRESAESDPEFYRVAHAMLANAKVFDEDGEAALQVGAPTTHGMHMSYSPITLVEQCTTMYLQSNE